jgi:uncharacterized protein (TIGR03083 family)
MAEVTPDRGAAFKAERAEVLAFCSGLEPAEWRIDSRCERWRIHDVVAHMGTGCRAMFGSDVAKMMRTNDIEETNDQMVDSRRDRSAPDVLAEYRRWSGVAAAILPVMARRPLGEVRMPLAELGRFPLRVLTGAMVFDHHTHLRHDMAPALGRPAPGTDANRMAVVLEWMMAVLSNQVSAAAPVWLDRPLAITLTGPGGGTWRVTPEGAVIPGSVDGSVAQITCAAIEFPDWGTQRSSWRDHDVRISGDADYALMFLDTVNVV